MSNKDVFNQIRLYQNAILDYREKISALSDEKAKFYKDMSIPVKERFLLYAEFGGSNNIDHKPSETKYPSIRKFVRELLDEGEFLRSAKVDLGAFIKDCASDDYFDDENNYPLFEELLQNNIGRVSMDW